MHRSQPVTATTRCHLWPKLMTHYTCFLSSVHSQAWVSNPEPSVVRELGVLVSLGVVVSVEYEGFQSSLINSSPAWSSVLFPHPWAEWRDR